MSLKIIDLQRKLKEAYMNNNMQEAERLTKQVQQLQQQKKKKK
jgi:hypothetical protein